MVQSAIVRKSLSDVVVAYRRHLTTYLLRIPHVVLVGQCHEIARGPHRGRLEIGIQPKVALVDDDPYE